MKNWRFALVLLPVLTGAAPSSAQDIGLTATVAFESRYVFRGVQLSEESFQPALTATLGKLSATAWFNFPIDNADPAARMADEIDLVLDYALPSAGPLSFNVGLTYYVYPDRDRGFFDLFREDGSGLGANSLEPYVSVALEAPLSPKLTLFHDFNFDTTTVQINLARSFALAERTSFDLSGYAGYVFDDAGGVDFLYGAASANISHKLSDRVSIYAGGRFGGSDIAGGSVFDGLGLRKSSGLWAGAGLTASF